MKISASSKYLGENVNKKPEVQKSISKKFKKVISLTNNNIKNEIYKKLNEGSVLNFIRTSKKKATIRIDDSDSQKMKYDLSMLKKYEEKPNKNLSFISEFDLENEDKGNNSFNSSFDENSFGETDIIEK